jgi:hypothetical protein
MPNKKERAESYRCLYPLVAADLDPDEFPQAFEFMYYDWDDDMPLEEWPLLEDDGF